MAVFRLGEPKSRTRPRSQSPQSSEEASVMEVERRAGRKVEIVKNRPTEGQPEAVPEKARRAGEVRARWAWTEPTVWTERLVTALEAGVKGGQWSADPQRWPNAFFQGHGLYSMTAAHALLRQSSCR